MRWLALLMALAVGCGSTELTPDRDKAAVALAMAIVTSGLTPTPAPAPDDATGECWNCGGDGIVGDTREEKTCTICNGTGRLDPQAVAEPQDPISVTPALESSNQQPGTRWRGYGEAVAEQARTGRPILVLVEYSDAEQKASCEPCKRVRLYLKDSESFARFAELGIPTLGETDVWQQGSAVKSAPMLCYVPDANAPGAMLQTLGRSKDYPRGFVTGSAEAFLESVEAWIHATDD